MLPADIVIRYVGFRHKAEVEKLGKLPLNEEVTGTARREGIFVVTGQKSAEVVVVANLLTRKARRRAEHEENGGAVTNSIWTLNPTG